jgi:hypothetical protein
LKLITVHDAENTSILECNYNFSCGIQNTYRTVRDIISFWARRTDNCKYLSNSPAVNLLVRFYIYIYIYIYIYRERERERERERKKSSVCYPKLDCLYKRYAQAGIEYQRQ